MIEKSDAFLTLPGGLGTLDELFEVWTTATLGLHRKPMVLLDAGRLLRRSARMAARPRRPRVRPPVGD